jgi:GntR family transcriptional regulator, transcriptional repressor for pyruvate dehydrogenase complex
MSSKIFKPLGTEKLSEKAITQIEDLINKGVLKPGDKLPPERELSLELHVSRSILREALKTLEGLGYLYRRTGGGTFVREISDWNSGLFLSDMIKRATLLDYLEAREMLEQKVVQLVIERASDEELKEIDKIIALLEGPELNSELVLQFHHKLALMTKNIVLIKFMLANWELHKNLVIANNVVMDEGRTKTVAREHKAILTAIKERNVEKARQAVLTHLNNIRKHLADLLLTTV